MTSPAHLTEPIRYPAILLLGPPGSGKGTFGRALGRLPELLFVFNSHRMLQQYVVDSYVLAKV